MRTTQPNHQTTNEFRALKKQAEEKVLLVSPPYGDRRAESAFLAGYEAALKDIALGMLDVRRDADASGSMQRCEEE